MYQRITTSNFLEFKKLGWIPQYLHFETKCMFNVAYPYFMTMYYSNFFERCCFSNLLENGKRQTNKRQAKMDEHRKSWEHIYRKCIYLYLCLKENKKEKIEWNLNKIYKFVLLDMFCEFDIIPLHSLKLFFKYSLRAWKLCLRKIFQHLFSFRIKSYLWNFWM